MAPKFVPPQASARALKCLNVSCMFSTDVLSMQTSVMSVMPCRRINGVFLLWCKSANVKDLVLFRVYMFKQVLHLWICQLQVCRDPILCHHGVKSAHASRGGGHTPSLHPIVVLVLVRIMWGGLGVGSHKPPSIPC